MCWPNFICSKECFPAKNSIKSFSIYALCDHYIVLQHLRNRRLIAAANERQYDIHRLSEMASDKTLNLFVRTDRNSVKFSPDVIEQQGGIGAAITCTSDLPIGIWFCFPMNVSLTLAMPTDAREFMAVRESVLPLRASFSGTVSEVVQS